MATAAIDPLFGLELPSFGAKISRKGPKNSGKHVARSVRRRNERAGRPWWQPSRSRYKVTEPRATVREAAIAAELDERAKSPDEFWSDDTVAYSDCSRSATIKRRRQERKEIEARQTEILDGIEAECCAKLMELRAEEARLNREILETLWDLSFRYEGDKHLGEKLEHARLELDIVRLELEQYAVYAEAA